MTVAKKNLFIPGQNVTNMGNNVDYNRVNNDKTSIEVDFTGSPAEVTIKAGSLIESNGNLYSVDSDVVITMNGATDNYILFDDTALAAPAWGFTSSTSRGTFDPAKQGFYSGIGNTIRTVKWYVDQVAESIGLDTTINQTLTDDMQLTADMRMADFTKFVDTFFIFTGTTSALGVLTINTSLNLDDYMVSGAMYERTTPGEWIDNRLFTILDTSTNQIRFDSGVNFALDVRITLMKFK